MTINGIDTEKFSPQTSGQSVVEEFGLDRSRPVVSYVSRMDEDRALVARQLIQIAEELDRTVPGVQLLIAGGGNVFRELKEQAEAVNARMGPHLRGDDRPTHRHQSDRGSGGHLRRGVPVGAGGHVRRQARHRGGKRGVSGPLRSGEAGGGPAGQLLLPGTAHVHSGASAGRYGRRPVPLPGAEGGGGAYGREVIFQYYSVRRMAADCLAMYEQVRRRKYQVVMSGYYGFSNAGDDAILEAIHQSILEASGEVGVTVLSNDPRETQRHYGMNAIPRFRFWKVFGALRRCDALLSGGGSLLQDRTSTRSLLYYLSIVRCAEWMGKPVMLYANGIGPVQKPANRRRVKRAVERAALVTLRDHSSARELVEMGVERPDLHVTADPVFNLDPAPKERAGELLRSAGLERGTPFAAVSVRDWPDTGSFAGELAALCDHLYRTCGMEILFLMMQPCRDRAATAQVRSAMECPSHLLDAPAPRGS